MLLAGGSGTRMGASVPKQYLILEDQPIIQYSLEALRNSAWIDELIVVCGEDYQHLFGPDCRFARPGPSRQESVRSGFREIQQRDGLVLVHDGARPFLCETQLEDVIGAAIHYGAAVLALPMKATVKQASSLGFVQKTLDRSVLWEIQTPQVLRFDLMDLGFQLVDERRLEVTDDVSLAELCGHPVKLVQGSEQLLKITTPFDLEVAKSLLKLYNYSPQLEKSTG